MENLIGEKLDIAINKIKELGYAYTVKDNNHSVIGDTKLVTNAVVKDKTVYITTGDFIFDVRNKKNEE